MRAKEAEINTNVPYHDIDVRWEAMVPVLRGEIPVFIQANEVKQIKVRRQSSIKRIIW